MRSVYNVHGLREAASPGALDADFAVSMVASFTNSSATEHACV